MIASFCGLPGAGKSTLIREVAKAIRATAWLENVGDYAFVEDAPSRDCARAFLNQADFLVKKMGDAAKMQAIEGVHLVEMDWSVCHVLWTGALLRSARITPAQGASLQLIYEAGISRELPLPGVVFHLRAPLETIHSRVRSRGRPQEHGYTSLLADLHSQEASALSELDQRRLHVFDAASGVRDLAAAVLSRLGE